MNPLLVALLLPLHASAVSWPSLLDGNSGGSIYFGVALGGKQPFARNDTELLAPASNAKLFTAGAVLEALGPAFRYSTKLRWREPRGGVATDLIMEGNGDPSWGLSELGESPSFRFDQMAAALKASGVIEVSGPIQAVAADPRWNQIRIPQGWKPSDTTSCGGALATAFTVSLNCATLNVTSPSRATWAGEVVFPVQLAVKAGKWNDLNAQLVQTARGWAFRIEGTWKAGVVSMNLPIYDARATAGAMLRSALSRAGIKLTRGALRGKGAPRELTFESPPLSLLLKPFLKNSVNFLGDSFLKTLGLSRANPDLLAGGLEALQGYLARNGVRSALLNDGSGLSRTSRVAARELFDFLVALQRSPEFPAIWAALPIAGVDGTLRNRMKGTEAEGRLRAKTGTLDGVYNLAGYIPEGRDYVPFVILTRTTAEHASEARAAADRVGAALSDLHPDPAAGGAAPFPALTAFPEAPFPYVPEHAGFDDQ